VGRKLRAQGKSIFASCPSCPLKASHPAPDNNAETPEIEVIVNGAGSDADACAVKETPRGQDLFHQF